MSEGPRKDPAQDVTLFLNGWIFPTDANVDFNHLVAEHSATADLVILGFTMPRLSSKGPELLQRHPELNDILFVCAEARVAID